MVFYTASGEPSGTGLIDKGSALFAASSWPRGRPFNKTYEDEAVAKIRRIFIAGHRVMLGRAILRQSRIHSIEPEQIVTQANVELDMTDQTQALDFFQVERIGEAYLAAAKVGDIGADNTHPAEFIKTKLMLKPNVVHQAFSVGRRRSYSTR